MTQIVVMKIPSKGIYNSIIFKVSKLINFFWIQNKNPLIISFINKRVQTVNNFKLEAKLEINFHSVTI